MGAARWAVVGTALVAAAAAFHLLTSPTGPGKRSASTESLGSERAGGNGWSAGGVAIGREDGPPQEELDAASRDAMRDFLRGSLDERASSDGAE